MTVGRTKVVKWMRVKEGARAIIKRPSGQCLQVCALSRNYWKVSKNVFLKSFKMQKYSEANITKTTVFPCKSFVTFSSDIFIYNRKKMLLTERYKNISLPWSSQWASVIMSFDSILLIYFFFIPSLCSFIHSTNNPGGVPCAGQDSRLWGYSKKQNCQKSLFMGSMFLCNMIIHKYENT